MSSNKVVPTDRARLAVIAALNARTGGTAMARTIQQAPAPTSTPAAPQ